MAERSHHPHCACSQCDYERAIADLGLTRRNHITSVADDERNEDLPPPEALQGLVAAVGGRGRGGVKDEWHNFSKVDPHPDPVALANPSLYDGHLARFNRGALVPKGNLPKAGSIPPLGPVEVRTYAHPRTSLGSANYGHTSNSTTVSHQGNPLKRPAPSASASRLIATFTKLPVIILQAIRVRPVVFQATPAPTTSQFTFLYLFHCYMVKDFPSTNKNTRSSSRYPSTEDNDMAFREAMAKLRAKSAGLFKSRHAPQVNAFEGPAGGGKIGPIQHLGLQHDTLGFQQDALNAIAAVQHEMEERGPRMSGVFQQDALNALGIQSETEERTVRMSGVTLVEDQTNIAEGTMFSGIPCIHHRNRNATELPHPSLRNSFRGWGSSSSDCAVDGQSEEADEEVVTANPQEEQAVPIVFPAVRPTVATTSDNRPIFVSSPTREECLTLTPAELDEAMQSDYHTFLQRNHRHVSVYQAGPEDDVADFRSVHDSIHESINESIHEAASIYEMFPDIAPPAPVAPTTAPTNNAAAPMVPVVTPAAAPAMPSRPPPAVPAGPVVAPAIVDIAPAVPTVTTLAAPVFFGAAPVAFTSGPVVEPVVPAITPAAPIVDAVDAPVVPATTSEAPVTAPGAPAAAVASASLAQDLVDSTVEANRPLSKAESIKAHHAWLEGKGLKDSMWAH
ncbi:hypothetical protein H2199_004669 [Coniosporium tulheliwenetii]|uniref:Uncharacterized protein n=1 Tax=Coniosporium tulheliwenetii TaxID=3383036 RepID=A0ACC2Z4K3_9PEZI|nr:hypothetical protein H2199_004669 [Cladosporium sp. JES 115]